MNRVSRYTAAGAPDAIAAPAGGAGVFGRLCWGCFNFTLMTGLFTLVAALPLRAEVLPLSGLEFAFHDEIDEAPTFRMRYVVPALSAAEIDFDAMADDMAQLCATDALPRLAEQGANPYRVVVTLMAEPVEFGVMTPEIRQFFESYTVEDGLCIWEAF